MKRILGIAVAFVVALTLTTERASAQKIFACVNNSSGGVRIVSKPTCNNNETLVNVGGALAGADYQCVPQQQVVNVGNPLFFQPGVGGVTFGSAPRDHNLALSCCSQVSTKSICPEVVLTCPQAWVFQSKCSLAPVVHQSPCGSILKLRVTPPTSLVGTGSFRLGSPTAPSAWSLNLAR